MNANPLRKFQSLRYVERAVRAALLLVLIALVAIGLMGFIARTMEANYWLSEPGGYHRPIIEGRWFLVQRLRTLAMWAVPALVLLSYALLGIWLYQARCNVIAFSYTDLEFPPYLALIVPPIPVLGVLLTPVLLIEVWRASGILIGKTYSWKETPFPRRIILWALLNLALQGAAFVVIPVALWQSEFPRLPVLVAIVILVWAVMTMGLVSQVSYRQHYRFDQERDRQDPDQMDLPPRPAFRW